jgi:hypothetical protein
MRGAESENMARPGNARRHVAVHVYGYLIYDGTLTIYKNIVNLGGLFCGVHRKRGGQTLPHRDADPVFQESELLQTFCDL